MTSIMHPGVHVAGCLLVSVGVADHKSGCLPKHAFLESLNQATWEYPLTQDLYLASIACSHPPFGVMHVTG